MAHSHLRFQSSVGGKAFTGTFGRWHADIRFDPRNLAGSSVLVKVNMASARTGSSDCDEALPAVDWFASGKFAQATFACRTFKDLGGGRYQAIDTLNMRGVSRPLVLPFTLAIQGKQARMTGTATVDRHVFGVGPVRHGGHCTLQRATHSQPFRAAWLSGWAELTSGARATTPSDTRWARSSSTG